MRKLYDRIQGGESRKKLAEEFNVKPYRINELCASVRYRLEWYGPYWGYTTEELEMILSAAKCIINEYEAFDAKQEQIQAHCR